MAWDFSTEPEFQEKLDWVEEFCRDEIEPLDLVFPGAVRSRDPEVKAAGRPAAAPGQGPGPVGAVPRQGARRPRLRPAQAGAAQRDPRPLPVGARDLRRRRARHRQHGDARRVRHRRAEEALARAADEPGDVLGVLDDRAPGRVRPDPVQDPRRHATATSGSSTARSGSPAPGARRHPLRHVHQRHVRRAARDAGRRDHARARAPQPHPLQRRARPARPPARPGGRRQGAGAAPARRRPDPPRHAHDRAVQAGLRHDVRAGAQPAVARQGDRRAPDGAGGDRRLVRRDQHAAAAGAVDGVDDRQLLARRRRARRSPRASTPAPRCCTRCPTGRCTSSARSA